MDRDASSGPAGGSPGGAPAPPSKGLFPDSICTNPSSVLVYGAGGSRFPSGGGEGVGKLKPPPKDGVAAEEPRGSRGPRGARGGIYC